MEITTATLADLDALAAIEAACFPAAEAAAREEIEERLRVYAAHFYIAREKGAAIGFVDGMVTDEKDLLDELYADAARHDEKGAWQMIFGLNTLPEYRRRGVAAALIEAMCAAARAQGRRGVVLTCKEHLLPYYAKFGFCDEGLSASTHGGAVWHQMRRTF